MAEDELTFLMEDATILWPNFRGAPSQFNREGDRNFCIALPETTAQKLTEDGWNVKLWTPNDEDGDPIFYLQVAVKFTPKPPQITVITSAARTMLSEATVANLDVLDLKVVDVFLNGYRWQVQDKSGVKAYLRTMYATVNEDPLQIKYAQKD